MVVVGGVSFFWEVGGGGWKNQSLGDNEIDYYYSVIIFIDQAANLLWMRWTKHVQEQQPHIKIVTSFVVRVFRVTWRRSFIPYTFKWPALFSFASIPMKTSAVSVGRTHHPLLCVSDIMTSPSLPRSAIYSSLSLSIDHADTIRRSLYQRVLLFCDQSEAILKFRLLFDNTVVVWRIQYTSGPLSRRILVDAP